MLFKGALQKIFVTFKDFWNKIYFWYHDNYLRDKGSVSSLSKKDAQQL